MDELWLELGKAPISDAAPAGEDAKYDEEYEQMAAELAKLEAVSVDDPIDWNVVIDLSTGILKNRSKDILAASYLAHGLFQKQGLVGFTGGLNVIKDMLETHYDGMFPPVKRIKARANAMTWMADKTEPLITALDPKAKDYESLNECLDLVNSVQSLCDDKMADKGPALGSLKRAVRNWRDHLKVEVDKQAKQAEAAAAPTPTAPAASPTPAPAAAPKPIAAAAPIGDVASDKDVKAAIKSIQDVGRKIAQHKRDVSPADPAAYSLLRTTIWMQVERLPPVENGQTQLPELDPDRQKLLQNLLDSGSYNDLLKGAESAFCDSMFWLGAHRFAAAALEGLGHDKAKTAVIQSLAAFLNNFPDLLNYKFNSGALFADEMTRLWIEDQVLGGASASSSGSGQGDAWSSALQSALSEAGKGNFKQGLSVMQDGIKSATDGREQFMWSLSCAQYFEKTGHMKLAVPQLEHLWQQVLSKALEEWEQQSTVDVAKSLYACYSHKSFKNELNEIRKERMGELKSVIYRLDIDAALVLEG